MVNPRNVLHTIQSSNVFSDFNECLQLSCANGGTCINIQGSYQCRCPEGWTGQNCEIGKVLK